MGSIGKEAAASQETEIGADTETMKNEKIVLIDGHSILNRAFYGVPDLSNSAGLHTNAVYGFLNILFKILDEEQADYLAVAFDLKTPTFRHQMYSAYKGTRKPMPPELSEQVPVIKEMLTAMGIPLMMLEGYEADDLLGTVSRQMEERGLTVSIISGDRDLLQLASDTTCVRIPKTKRTGTEIEDYRAADVLAKYLVNPSQIIELKALMGDNSDNIPGIPGVGEKTAAKIIAEFGSIENAYAHVEEIRPNKAKESLREHYDLAKLSKALATIDRNSPYVLDLEAARIGNLYTPAALELCKKLEFKNMLSRFEKADAQPPEPKERFRLITDLAEAEAFLARAARAESVGVCVLEEDGHLLGVALSCEKIAVGSESEAGEDPEAVTGDAAYVSETPTGKNPKAGAEAAADVIETSTGKDPENSAENAADVSASETEQGPEAVTGAAVDGSESETGKDSEVRAENAESEPGDTACLCVQGSLTEVCLREKLREALAQVKRVSAIHLKEQLNVLGTEARERYFDAAIGAYLINPLKNEYTYDDIARDFTGKQLPAKEELLGKRRLAEVLKEEPAIFGQYACDQALAARISREPILRRLREQGMERLFLEIEMPLVFALYGMEREGILVRGEELKRYGEQLQERILELEAEIYKLAGESFNINSPKQLGVILFEKLKMPYGKKTKTGYSTAADVLERLAEEYPLVSRILEYRQLTKLKSTYADGLYAFIREDGRIHGKFHQTITATGRISSADPNLQNIPVRTELGRELRKVFVPKPGFVFLDADYSQIELRVLAHVSGDPQLIAAYQEAQDIHAITASQVFHVPLDQVTPLERRNAKAVNFGIVYGISSFGLSQDLSITRKEAQEYIEQYFRTYPGIKRFLDGAVSDAKKKGYAVTLFGRRRPVPELRSSNFAQRSFGERVAMNSPIQGTAADIIKIAMVRVDEELQKAGLESRLILQVHDELLIETKREELEQVSAILAREMAGAADLAVPLEIDMHTGESWYDAK